MAGIGTRKPLPERTSLSSPGGDMEGVEEVEEEVEEEEVEEEGVAGKEGTKTESVMPVPARETGEVKKWPGWPGDNVFRMVVPVLKVGSVIGRKGELIKKLCEETCARVRVLDGPIGTSDRIVLISGREMLEATLSPAMDAAVRVYKHINGITENKDGVFSASTGSTICSVRLLVPSAQAVSLIGKRGAVVKLIQENSGATIRVLSRGDASLCAASDERIIDIQGDPIKVLKAFEGVIGHLRKFLVDHGVLPSFEKIGIPEVNSVPQEPAVDSWANMGPSVHASQSGVSRDYSLSYKQDPLLLDHERQLGSGIQQSGLSLYGQDPAMASIHSLDYGNSAGTLITQITQTMQIPLSYAEDIIGVAGKNIAYIRRTSGAIITLQESRGLPDEMSVEIKGTSTQVRTAQELTQEFMSRQRERAPIGSYGRSYGSDSGLRASYSQLSDPSYRSSMTSQYYDGYDSAGISGYSRYRPGWAFREV